MTSTSQRTRTNRLLVGAMLVGGAAVALELARTGSDSVVPSRSPLAATINAVADESRPAPALAALGRAVDRRPVSASGELAASSGADSPLLPAVLAVIRSEFLAVDPGMVDDRVVPAAYAPFAIPRSEIVGLVLPYGVRDVAAASPPRWVGVARIEPDPEARSKPVASIETHAITALHGIVVGEDGRPVPGAEVIVDSSVYVRQAFYDHRVQQIGRALTDAEGVFDLRPIALDTVHFGADGEVLVTVRHPVLADIVAQPLPAIVPGRETDVGRLVLPTRGATVHGLVLDLTGRPVAGAVVRVSGALDPTAYDKTERMVVLDECPAVATDADGRYALSDFAAGVHEISVHIRIDCVLHVSERFEGDREWSPRVRAGNAVRGRVLDRDGEPLATAVVIGGGNWTPTNADGTFWLDNVDAGPLTLGVVHHDWYGETVPNVVTNADEITVTMKRALPRVTWTVVDAEARPIELVAIDWTWPAGRGPGPFAQESRYWHDPRGVFALVAPEGVLGAKVSDAKGQDRVLGPEDLVDGVRRSVTLAAHAVGR